jgi:hypothetical protein
MYLVAHGAATGRGQLALLCTTRPLRSVLTSKATLILFRQMTRSTGLAIATFRTSDGYAISGDLSSIVVVPDIHVAKTATQTVTLVSLIAKIESGTSIDVTVRRNGTAVGAARTVTTTKQTFTYSQALADGDALDLVFANPVGTPKDIGATLVTEQVVTG